MTLPWRDRALERIIPSAWNISPPLSSTPTLVSPSPEYPQLGPCCSIRNKFPRKVSWKPWHLSAQLSLPEKPCLRRAVSQQSPMVVTAEAAEAFEPRLYRRQVKSSHCGAAEMNPTSIHGDSGSIPCLTLSGLRIWCLHELCMI